MRIKSSVFTVLGVFALGILAFTTQATAAISDQLVLTGNGGDSVTITPTGGIVYNAACILDGCSVSDSTDTATEISVNGTLGAYNLVVDVGIDSLGLTAPALMDLTVNDAKNLGNSAGSLTIAYTETGMTQAYAGFTGTDGGTQDGSSVTYNIALSGTQIGTTGAQTNSSPGPGSGASFSGSLGSSTGSSGTYTLTQQVVLAYSAKNEDDSGDFHLSSVPEPASITLLGGVLLVTVTAIRKKVARG